MRLPDNNRRCGHQHESNNRFEDTQSKRRNEADRLLEKNDAEGPQESGHQCEEFAHTNPI